MGFRGAVDCVGSSVDGMLDPHATSFMKTTSVKSIKKQFPPLGHKRWVIPEGYIPEKSNGPKPAMLSHEAACILNATKRDATVEIWIFYSDREPVGPYTISVPAQRTRHIRFNDLKDPAPIPPGTNYASVIEADLPIVVQHTRLDSRQAANALMTTMAFPDR
jgi:hypothetical protein